MTCTLPSARAGRRVDWATRQAPSRDSRYGRRPGSGAARPRIPRESVLRDRLPRRAESTNCLNFRADARIAVERPEADGDLLVREWISAEERRAAPPAEELRHACGRFGRTAAPLALEQTEARPRDATIDRGAGARPPLAVRAVAVARGDERCRDLKTDRPAQAATLQGRCGRGGSGMSAIVSAA